MGRIFITDEVNDSYTAKVSKAGRVQVEDAIEYSYMLDSAITTISAQTAASACWLKSVHIGRIPVTAAALYILNTVSSAGGWSGFGSSGDNIVAKIEFDTGAGSAASCGLANLLTGKAPVTLPFNVYLASGLSLGHGSCFGSTAGGALRDVTVTYQY